MFKCNNITKEMIPKINRLKVIENQIKQLKQQTENSGQKAL